MPKYSVWDVAPLIADDLTYYIKELIPEGVKRIECRFQGSSPLFIAIIHSNKGRLFGITGNSEYKEQSFYEEMGFDYDKYEKISDTVMCLYEIYNLALSDISKEEFEKRFLLNKGDYERVKEKYSDHSADFFL